MINKKALYLQCLDSVDSRIEKYQEEMDTIKDSMDSNDIKTDYDEDNRGQLLGDFEKYAGYLSRAREMKETLSTIDLNHFSETVNFGSLVETDSNYYFIAAPLGEIQLEDGSKVYVLSKEAPIYQVMKGRKAGEKFNFNDQEIQIREVH